MDNILFYFILFMYLLACLGILTTCYFCQSQPRWLGDKTSKLFLISKLPTTINHSCFTQALIKASRSGQDVEKRVFQSTLAIFFLGVPHRGLHTDALISMVQDQENEHLIRDLGSHSQYLDMLHTTFCDLFRLVDFRTISIYETRLSNTVKESIYLPS